MKKVICSFADSKFSKSIERLKLQIERIGIFDECLLFNERDLDDSFIKTYQSQLVAGSRGYGYWVWKPYIIKRILDSLNEGDSLLYIDAGCHINYKGVTRLNRYFELLDESKSGIIAFQLHRHLFKYTFYKKKIQISDYYLERNWTKGDILDYFNVRFSDDIINTPQILSGIIFIKKCNKSISLINDWMNVYEKNFSLIDDSASKSKNLSGFLKNRHDQSVFSILCKLYKIDKFTTDEIEAEPAIINNNPILAIRDIGDRFRYKSFSFYRFTRIIKSPWLYIGFKKNPKLLD